MLTTIARLALPGGGPTTDTSRWLTTWSGSARTGERAPWVCGPYTVLEQSEQVWASAGLSDCLHLERFGVTHLGGEAPGGTVHFAVSNRTIQVDGATTLLQAGEQAGGPMPFGCRMSICHTCVIPLTSGRVPDLRNGSEYGDDHRTMRFATS
ncbi:MAG TPA: iron-sulfur cluster-binding domain-containing protein [Pseudonocardiaceae bacterium]